MKTVLIIATIVYLLYIIVETSVSIYLNYGWEKGKKQKRAFSKWYHNIINRKRHKTATK